MKNQTLRTAHINIRSLSSSFAIFKEFVLGEGFDVVGVTETWLTKKIKSKDVEIPGYRFVRQDRVSRGGGVGIYIRGSIKFSVIDNEFTKDCQSI